MRRLFLILIVAMAYGTVLASVASAQQQPQFVFGFKALADMIPNIVGQPLENEHFDPVSGDALQRTTRGLLVWRKADNWSAFTDGTNTWINGPYGLQERPNSQRFSWEAQGAQSSSVPSPASGTVSLGASVGGYQEFQFTDQQGRAMNFLMNVPPSTDPSQKFPLVLVLEGSGEEALPGMTPTQGLAILAGHPYVSPWVPDPANPGAPNVQSSWPSFVVIPQLTYPNRWVDVSGSQGSYQLAPSPTVGLEMAKELLDTLQAEYSAIDASRLYVTGISMGAYGTWEMAERWPGYFAAAAPVAGGGDPSKAYLLKNLPVWVFQGAADPIDPPSASRDMVAAIQAAGGNPKYTEYPGFGHDDGVWATVYNVTAPSPNNLFQWLFAQHRSSAAPPTPPSM